MSNNKTFNIVLVKKGYGIDTQTPATFNKSVPYAGKMLMVNL